jgi:GT2 family glycosyltransferase
VQFAPELAFHLYDMEFCQRAYRAGLRLGVWPIAITHYSGGNYDSDNWKQAYKTFCQLNWPTASDSNTANPATKDKTQGKAPAAPPPARTAGTKAS